MIEPLLKRLRLRDDLGDAEEARLRECLRETRELAAGEVAVDEGQKLDASIVLLSGFMCRYKDLRGGSRQIIEVNVPGDFVDLHGFTLKRLDHSIAAMTRCKIGLISHQALTRISEDFPHLTRLLWFTNNVDAAVHREWVLSLGRRPAVQRLAHLLCELESRLAAVDLVSTEGPLFLALRQVDIADCLGLTAVHVNRVLHDLRDRGWIELQRGQIAILDIAGLRAFAEFDDGYLFLERQAI